ncbi:MAG: sterol desaturase family protein [Pseudomonadales bacterium]|nr:sterol desaturase family protein [Pseudomonadales bacterium]
MNDALLRLAIFGAALFMLFLGERVFRWHRVPTGRTSIRIANFGLGAVGALAVRLLLPWAGVAAALAAEQRSWGVLHSLGYSGLAAGMVGFLALDLAIYWQHRVTHSIPLLWRLHRVHHTEEHLDFTSALRFHPVEIVLSAAWRWLVIVALGIPALAVFVFETVLNTAALFNHANLRLPVRLDRTLRLVLVTPAVHRVHHSIEGSEQHRNFGFNLPWWDWLFASYSRESRQGPDVAQIGVIDRPAPHERPFRRLFIDPFI